MSDKFNACHVITARWEGGWSDHPADPGGKTMYGITQATLSRFLGRPATTQEIRTLTKTQAKAIYKSEYWAKVGGDALPAGVDLCVYDFGVNSGPSRAVKSLQAALGVEIDGWFGEVTLAAILKTDPVQLIDRLCDRRLAFLRRLPTWGAFGKGWSNRVADVRAQAKRMARGAGSKTSPPVTPTPPASTAKALPPPVVEKTVSTDQKVGGLAAGVVVAVGPVAGFWRDNRDLLTDPIFIAVVGVLAAITVFMLLRKPKLAELDG